MEIKDIKQAVEEGVKPFIDEIKEKQKAGEEAIIKLQADLKAAREATEVKEIKDNLDKTIEAVDQLSIKLKQSQNERIEQKGFGGELQEELKAKAKELSDYKKERRPVTISLKAVGNIGAGNFTTSGTGGFVDQPMIGYAPQPFNQTHFRNYFQTVQWGGDSIPLLRDNGGEGGPTTVAVGGTKPQSDRDWVKIYQPITKIAHHFDIPEEYLEDITWLQNEIVTIGREELLAVEDAEIYSNAAAGEFTGLVQNSTPFAAPAELALGVNMANPYDVLVAAWTQGNQAKVDINTHFLNHGDFAKMVLTKATDGQYLFGPNQMFPNVLGVPVVPINQIASDKFLSVNRNMITIAIRRDVNVRFYDQHANNAITNMVTVVIEERLAPVVRRVKDVIYGDFSDAAAALETA